MDRRERITRKRPMEMNMSTTLSTPVAAQGAAGQATTAGPGAILRRWWRTYLTWRIEHAAISQLDMMSDRELKDIGLTRPQIIGAVRGQAGHRSFSRYY